MGIGYVSLHGELDDPMEFLDVSVSDGEITLTWSGEGVLEWAPDVEGPWNPVEPAPSSTTYTEDIIASENRFYRLSSE